MRRRQILVSGTAAVATTLIKPSWATEPPLRLGYGSRVQWLPWAIAEAEGLFAKHGVAVELRRYNSPAEANQDLRLGQLDVNCASFADAIINQARSLYGSSVVLVLANSRGADRLIVDQTINLPLALRGRRLAIQEGSISDYFLQSVIESFGISRISLDIVNMQMQAAANSFASGLYDAVCVYAPHDQRALQRPGSRVLVDSSSFPGLIVDVLIASETAINPRAAELQRLINVWFDALSFLRNNPEQAANVMAPASGFSATQVQAVIGGTEFVSVQGNLNAFLRGGQMNNLSYAADILAEFLQFRGQLTAIPPLHRLLEPRFVQEYARLVGQA